MKSRSLCIYTLAFFACVIIIAGIPGYFPAFGENIRYGNPSNYLTVLRDLHAGDTLILEPGVYNNEDDVPGLPIFDLNGEPDSRIIITGPEEGARPILYGRSGYNTVRLANASYITIRNIEIDGRNLGGDGVNAQGISHHITLENLYIHGCSNDQQTVGISTNGAPTWNWNIRSNTITDTGTGMYLGNYDGSNPFVNGIIENNLIYDTIGYNIEIKHQNSRPSVPGMPTGKSSTIIRHNVFSKANNASTGSMARPNLLVGHFPLSGEGSGDVYQIYGNFFYQNPSDEPLFQGEGNVALYNNLFFNSFGSAVMIQPHNNVPRMVRIFNNTVVATGTGIFVTGGSTEHLQKVVANAVFAATPIQSPDRKDNVTDSFENANNYLVNPTGSLGQFDLYPKTGMLKGSSVDMSSYEGMFLEWNHDFNGINRDGTFRGAYGGEGQNPGWLPRIEKKPVSYDTMPPSPPTGLSVQ